MASSESTAVENDRVPGRLRLPQIFPHCENPECPTRRNFWPPVRRRSTGIHLGRQWLCSPACLERSLVGLFREIVANVRPWSPKPRRVPLGLLLLSRGVIAEEQLRVALERQRLAGREPLGYWLQEIGAATEQDVTAALAIQWACPVFPLERSASFRECVSMIPLPIVESARMLPVHFLPHSNLFYAGFVEGVDHSVLTAVERVLNCRALPCIIARPSFDRVFAEIRSLPNPELFRFESVVDPAEMSRITASFAQQLSAKQVVVAACREFAWIRFHSGTVERDLLFRLPFAE